MKGRGMTNPLAPSQLEYLSSISYSPDRIKIPRFFCFWDSKGLNWILQYAIRKYGITIYFFVSPFELQLHSSRISKKEFVLPVFYPKTKMITGLGWFGVRTFWLFVHVPRAISYNLISPIIMFLGILIQWVQVYLHTMLMKGKFKLFLVPLHVCLWKESRDLEYLCNHIMSLNWR